MTSESATSPAMPPPPEHQSLPQENPDNPELISAVPPSPPSQITMEDIVNSNGILTDQLIDEEPSYYKYLDSEEYAEKYRRYEADFKQYLVEKYFSGEEMYEERTLIDGETIYSSKCPSLSMYADPAISFVDPVQCLVEEEEVEVEEEVVQEVEEEVEEVEQVGEVEDLGELEEESVDSASAEIPNGEISNGGTIL